MINFTAWLNNRRWKRSAGSPSSSGLITPPQSYQTIVLESKNRPKTTQQTMINWRARVDARVPPTLPPPRSSNECNNVTYTGKRNNATASNQDNDNPAASTSSPNANSIVSSIVATSDNSIESMFRHRDVSSPVGGNTELFTITGNYVWRVKPFNDLVYIPIIKSPIFDTDSALHQVQFFISYNTTDEINLSVNIITNNTDRSPLINTCRITYSAKLHHSAAATIEPHRNIRDCVYSETLTVRPGKWAYTPIFHDLTYRHRLTKKKINALFPDNALELSIKLIGYSALNNTRDTETANSREVQYRLCENIHNWWLSFEFSDVLIITKTALLPAHRVILASASRVFRTMLQSCYVEGNTGRIRIEEFATNAVKDMLRYIYNHELLHLDNLSMCIFGLANMYELRGLCDICERYIISNIDTNNACDVYSLATLYNAQNMRQVAAQYIKSHIQRVRLTETYQRESRDFYKGLLEDMVLSTTPKKRDVNNTPAPGASNYNCFGAYATPSRSEYMEVLQNPQSKYRCATYAIEDEEDHYSYIQPQAKIVDDTTPTASIIATEECDYQNGIESSKDGLYAPMQPKKK
ncbi:Kelch repeat and BTB domain-containing protein 1 [Dolichomitus sp. PSUC_FEM 10030005]|nr:Kelch repeat and BTB domain-containing protein 1 [Dolichomitus sp. PSUC_FEM 10030005]